MSETVASECKFLLLFEITFSIGSVVLNKSSENFGLSVVVLLSKIFGFMMRVDSVFLSPLISAWPISIWRSRWVLYEAIPRLSFSFFHFAWNEISYMILKHSLKEMNRLITKGMSNIYLNSSYFKFTPVSSNLQSVFEWHREWRVV